MNIKETIYVYTSKTLNIGDVIDENDFKYQVIKKIKDSKEKENTYKAVVLEDN